ncbi:DsrE family protein [Sulfurimonas sp.]|uniref:DsrE family protein n=1 Tax=Sulfurimonas sp. TaxID=2022749 RepID=UPI0035698029
MKTIILTLLFLAVSAMGAEHKVVFSLTTSKENVLQEQLIKQVALLNKHYLEQGDSLKVAVVIYGGAYNFFLKSSNPTLKNQLQNLHEKYNVAFDMCGMGMKKRGITNSMIYNFVNPAFNKNVALIKWQNKGYAYIEIE